MPTVAIYIPSPDVWQADFGISLLRLIRDAVTEPRFDVQC